MLLNRLHIHEVGLDTESYTDCFPNVKKVFLGLIPLGHDVEPLNIFLVSNC